MIDHVSDGEICYTLSFLTQGDKIELIVHVRQKTTVVLYLWGCFLQFQLRTVNHSPEADHPPDILSEGQ